MSGNIPSATAHPYIPPNVLQPSASATSSGSNANKQSRFSAAFANLSAFFKCASEEPRDSKGRIVLEAKEDLLSSSSSSSLFGIHGSPFTRHAASSSSAQAHNAASSSSSSSTATVSPTVRTAVANLANELCKKLIEKEPNKSFSISSPSILVALGMFLLCISSDKKQRYMQAMGLGGIREDEVDREIGQLLNELQLPEDFKQGVMTTVQALVVTPKYAGSAAHLEKHLKDKYQAEVFITENIAQDVNAWVSKKTNGLIKTIPMSPGTKLALLNAIYLAFQWEQKFVKPEEGWSQEPFIFADGKSCRVSMMHQEEMVCSTIMTSKCSMTEIPYCSPQGTQLSLVVFVPHKADMLVKLEAEFNDPTTLQWHRRSARKETVELYMPKIKMESQFRLLEILQDMGFPLGDLDRNILHPDLAVDDIVHKTFVSIDEEGTKAAAVTAIEVTDECCSAPSPIIRIDRSFVYFIMNGNTMLFRGRVADPSPLVSE